MKGSLLSAEVVEPYAEALMAVAQEQNLVDKFGEDVASLLSLLDSSPELKVFISSPVVIGSDKKAILRRIGQEIDPIIVNFLMILVDRRRIIFLEGICQHFRTLIRKLNQTVLAEVISAIELNDSQKQAVVDQVKTLTQARDVELVTKIDPDLIGGVIIKVGSQVIDASLRGQLRRLSISLG
ncbi:MAG: F0F1 ATP synthase subunit delta [Coleofasciculaceae cyanobacterium SM2_1_6]|nr:F0F1 ATP synthase subunit delta [Coleofasciculaceae cyanobacterium SM2_1_6]